ncbi:cilia- and flagella-associated protein 90 [Brachyhypopomus gauderio]|uniref:cilia- and flagella-associated protein 90 n=1 Tax=Brachyhypopomus gauderio TaxID=698409 RepID=UPI004042CACA
MDVLSQAKSKPLSALSVFSYIPPRRNEPKEERYFNCNSKASEIYLYDCIYRRAQGYDNKLHRDDREHAKSRGLNIFNEEASRPIGVRSSSEYGRHAPPSLYTPDRRFVRVAHVRSEFYRKNGITKTMEEGYGSVVPV